MLPIILLAAGAGYWFSRVHKSKPSASAAKIHGTFMARVVNVPKLERAAESFKSKGLHSEARDLAYKAAQIRKQAVVAAELAEAARAGDQNAMGMIAAIKSQADRRNPRALVSAGLIADYCKRNPPRPLGPLGESAMLPASELLTRE